MPLPSSSHYASSDVPSTMHIHTVDIERTASTPEMSHCCAHVSINPQLFALAPEHSSTAHLVCLCSSSQSTAPPLLCLSLLLGACCCACLCLSLPLSLVSYLVSLSTHARSSLGSTPALRAWCTDTHFVLASFSRVIDPLLEHHQLPHSVRAALVSHQATAPLQHRRGLGLAAATWTLTDSCHSCTDS